MVSSVCTAFIFPRLVAHSKDFPSAGFLNLDRSGTSVLKTAIAADSNPAEISLEYCKEISNNFPSEKLGEGAHGTVFFGRDTTLNVDFVIKKVHFNLDDEDSLLSFCSLSTTGPSQFPPSRYSPSFWQGVSSVQHTGSCLRIRQSSLARSLTGVGNQAQGLLVDLDSENLHHAGYLSRVEFPPHWWEQGEIQDYSSRSSRRQTSSWWAITQPKADWLRKLQKFVEIRGHVLKLCNRCSFQVACDAW